MSWKPIDFHGIISLNQTVVEQLYQYLEEKESQTCRALMTSLHPNHGAPILEPSPKTRYKLLDAVDQVGKKIQPLIKNHLPIGDNEDWKHSAQTINTCLWEYLEVLEGSVIELFQQVDQVSIEDWREDLSHAIEAVKEILDNRLEDLKTAIKKMETILYDYSLASESEQGIWNGILRKLSFIRKSILDKGLLENTDKMQQFLRTRYQSFSDRYNNFKELSTKLDNSVQKFSWYKIFGTLEPEVQNKLKKLFRLTKLREMNGQNKAFPQVEINQAIRSLLAPEKAMEYLKEYDHALYKTLFINSRAIKENAQEFSDAEGLMKVQEAILSYRGEIQTLESMIKKYRDYVLANSPKFSWPKRLGLSLLGGREPSVAKQLGYLEAETKRLDNIYESFRQAMERKTVIPDLEIKDVDSDVQPILHEMAQPLLSPSMMKMRAERLIILVQQLDELTTSRKEIVEYVGCILNKALRLDWKHHVLFDLPDFHQVYGIHQGILGPSDDRHHLNRMQKFKHYLQQISRWFKNDNVSKHASEIELDMNDIKGYLQDFFANVQRLSKDETAENPTKLKWISEISQQLLEYRYLFGNFFRQLDMGNPEERLLRNQFLFVDQYFEAVDSKLHDWKELLH